MKEKFKEFLTDNMLLKEPVATIITNHVNHYYLTEIEGLKKENERVSGLVKMLFMAYRDKDTAEEKWKLFAKANNIKL